MIEFAHGADIEIQTGLKSLTAIHMLEEHDVHMAVLQPSTHTKTYLHTRSP